MTGGLASYGRADEPADWGATVMVRVTDPAAFGGPTGFHRELDWLVNACRSNPPINTAAPVRLPGERGLARKDHSLTNGLQLNPLVQTAIEELADETSIALPKAL